MPELPEVERSRRKLEHYLVGKTIATATADDDRKIFQLRPESRTPASLAASLLGQTVTAAERKGKHVWLVLSRGPCLCFHQGMTGAFTVLDPDGNVHADEYKEFKVDTEAWPPRFWKLVLTMDDGTSAAFTNARRFGRIRESVDPASDPSLPIAKLAPDPLYEMPSRAVFAEKVGARTANIKAFLLDQEKVVCGIGNWIADEVGRSGERDGGGVHVERCCALCECVWYAVEGGWWLCTVVMCVCLC